MDGELQKEDPERRFETLINSLKSIVERSKTQSDEFYTKVNSLYGFQPKCEKEGAIPSPTMLISGVMVEINALINEMDNINNRNRDILDHFDGLV